jgi:hypothetical protein
MREGKNIQSLGKERRGTWLPGSKPKVRHECQPETLKGLSGKLASSRFLAGGVRTQAHDVGFCRQMRKEGSEIWRSWISRLRASSPVTPASAAREGTTDHLAKPEIGRIAKYSLRNHKQGFGN